MRIVKKILLVLLVLCVVITIAGLLMPAKVHVERSLVMKASPEAVYSQVNDLKTWNNWATWNKKDPNWKLTYGDVTVGEGANYAWESTKEEVGNGSMKITQTIPGEIVHIDMDFREHGTAGADFKFEKADAGSKVTWSMDMDMGSNPIKRLMGPIMDKMVGKEFEKGLQNLDSVTANIPAPSAEMTVAPPDSTIADTTKK